MSAELENKIKDYENLIKSQKEEQEQILAEIEYNEKLYKQYRQLLNTENITTKKLLNDEESKIFKILINIKISKYPDINIFPQTPLSAFLKNNEKTDWYLYNKLYVDFLIVDQKTYDPLAVIEYHGGGHYGESEDEKKRTELNDDIKKEIIKNKAKIPLLEIKDKKISETIESFFDEGISLKLKKN